MNMISNNLWPSRRKFRGAGKLDARADSAPCEPILHRINQLGEPLRRATDAALHAEVLNLRERTAHAALEDLLPESFALTRELAHRVLGLRPFDVQVQAGLALHRGQIVEMQTGEGKTLAAVLPAAFHALFGHGTHVLTFNDYLARRDAAWMKPLYHALGLSVGVVQEGMDLETRRAAYAADVTYATAKEAGFDFLRGGLVRDPRDLVQRAFHYAIIDEADSILIDEARVPLVIAGARPNWDINPYRIAAFVSKLVEGVDWLRDRAGRNVQLTDQGITATEAKFGCGNLHAARNSPLLTGVNQALHARALIHREVDYVVRDGKIALIDDCTGRIVTERRWPDGLQTALEAKEGLAIQPGGKILGSITLRHFLAQYSKLAGMTATASAAANQLKDAYNLTVVSVPSHRPCQRKDLPDLIFSHREAKEHALVHEILRVHATGQPILVGTGSVEESEHLAAILEQAWIPCQVLNAKNDEAEAAIIAEAGDVGAVTISTHMAGRGTDIRLGGIREKRRKEVLSLGGLYVIGTCRHESRRIDEQLRGRAGRQGDPGVSRFFVSLVDPMMRRFGIRGLIPVQHYPPRQDEPLDSPIVRREVDRVQRIVEGQNQDIRTTLARYSDLVERQRASLLAWRSDLLTGEAEFSAFALRAPEKHAALLRRVGPETLKAIERRVVLHHLDEAWVDHLALIADLREGIHLVSLGGMDPYEEFLKRVAPAFRRLDQEIEDRAIAALLRVSVSDDGQLDEEFSGPSTTWTYLINDQVGSGLQRMLLRAGSEAIASAGIMLTWPLLLAWGLWRKLSKAGDCCNFHD